MSAGPAATLRQPPPCRVAGTTSPTLSSGGVPKERAVRVVALPFVDGDDDDDDDDDDNDHTYSYKAPFSAHKQTPCAFVVCNSKGWCCLLIVMAMMM